jgi:hypothetical protein
MNNNTLKTLKDNANFLQKLYVVVPQWLLEAEQGKLNDLNNSGRSIMKCYESIKTEDNIYRAKFYFGALFTANMTILGSEDNPIIHLTEICIGSGKDAVVLKEQDLAQLYWRWIPNNTMFWYLMAYYKQKLS